MAHFAQIDSENKVIQVVVVDDSQQHRGQEFLAIDCALGGIWIQTSYNGNIRKKYAAIGDFYDEVNDEFYSIETDLTMVVSTPVEQTAIEGA